MPDLKHNTSKHIASLLMQIMKLPKDDSLVLIFGTGYETNNLDAITHWVELHLNEVDDEQETLSRLRNVANGGNHATM